ncbi:hypothetical protein [Marinibacterium sp. SX1]|uniref:hypothetical protein n=1 Tax=Marinibacterium sp. SX1 TaxID=3388424 RepID=UPI003D182D20
MAEAAVDNILSVVEGGRSRSAHAERNSFGGGGGDGGEPDVDAETQRYLESEVRAAKAENSAAFARLEAKIDGIEPGSTWQQNAGIAFVLFTAVFGVLAYASDRFDSGVGAMGAVEEAIDRQREINASQDARLDKILRALEEQEARSESSPPSGSDR